MSKRFGDYDSPTEKSKEKIEIYRRKKQGKKKPKTIDTYIGGIEREKSRQLIIAYFNSYRYR